MWSVDEPCLPRLTVRLSSRDLHAERSPSYVVYRRHRSGDLLADAVGGRAASCVAGIRYRQARISSTWTYDV